MRRRLFLSLTAYVVLAVGIWFGLGRINVSYFRRLATEGTPTQATVQKTDCENHSSIHYSFEADRKTFTGMGLDGSGNPPCRSLRAGDRIIVWHIPDDPTINCPGDPRLRLDNERISVAMAAFMMPAIIVGVATWQLHRRRASEVARTRSVEHQ